VDAAKKWLANYYTSVMIAQKWIDRGVGYRGTEVERPQPRWSGLRPSSPLDSRCLIRSAISSQPTNGERIEECASPPKTSKNPFGNHYNVVMTGGCKT
jgi:hypothetical protein